MSSTIPLAEFQPWPKMARWQRDIIITEKIDGTNAQIFIDDEGNVRAGSRTRWITPENDNYGFAAWVEARKDVLRDLGPGRHYGEWWGSKIQRGYDCAAGERYFSLFNTLRWHDIFEEPRPVKTDPKTGEVTYTRPAPACCEVVPILYRGPMREGQIDYEFDQLQLKGSVAAPGFDNPEGIVIYHVAANVCFKRTYEHDAAGKERGA